MISEKFIKAITALFISVGAALLVFSLILSDYVMSFRALGTCGVMSWLFLNPQIGLEDYAETINFKKTKYNFIIIPALLSFILSFLV